MESLLRYLFRRLRPRVGWAIGLLALGAASAPGLAASDAALELPAGLIMWAGLLGAALGLRLARPLGPAWRALLLAALLAIGATLVVAGGAALPPPGLLIGDLRAALGAIAARLGWAPAGDPAPLLTGRFLALSLPRLWRALAAAPGAGEAGAALIVTTLALVTTWAGAIVLGWAAGTLRRSLAWGLPLLIALGLTSILSGSEGSALVIGVCLLLGLAVVVGHTAREQSWEEGGYAYPDQLGLGAMGLGATAALVTAGAALIIPTALPDFAVGLPGADVELPSGIAAIEGHVRRAQPAPAADPGLSRLPAVALGVSLAQGPPGEVSLRIRVSESLAPGPWPRYWRARVLNLYTGSAWTTNARVGPFSGLAPGDAPPGSIVQEVEDLREAPAVLVALPEALGLDGPAVAERLPDGSLAALAPPPEMPEPAADGTGGRYAVVSLPQELASAGAEEPDAPISRGDTLGLPASVTQRVRDLAMTVAGGAAAPMDRALALEAYLRDLPYAYEVRPLPRGGDAVDQFLFEMRHGYCTYYASAMAVMARSLGIPARIAVGYATGEYDPASGAYTVREGDAHAWPELLIDGRWLPFEPTPVRPLPERGAGDTLPAPVVVSEPEAVAAPRPLGPVWAGLGIAGAGLAAWGGWLAWRRARVAPLEREQLRLERLGARAGVPWPPGATVQEYGRLLAARATGPCDALDELVGLIERARYSGRRLSPTDERRLRSAGALLRARLRRRGAARGGKHS